MTSKIQIHAARDRMLRIEARESGTGKVIESVDLDAGANASVYTHAGRDILIRDITEEAAQPAPSKPKEPKA